MASPFLLAAALAWFAPTDPQFSLHGLPWLAENKGELIRLPRRLESQIPPPVWNLGLSPSGARIRFRTNSTKIAIRAEFPSPPNMINMHAFGQTGIDLYIDGVYRSTAIAPKNAAPGRPVEHVFFAELPKQSREITLYLPLYKPANVLSIGLDDDATVSRPRPFALPRPVVYYGTSITQGGCASRAGLSYQAILARKLNLDFVNLGFSGNGKGEPVMANLTAEIDASLFVLDFSQNNPDIASLRAAYEPFLKTVRAKHPTTPILAITPIATSSNNPKFLEYRDHIKEVVTRHQKAGDRLLTLLDGHTLLGPDRLDGLVDGVHPNDLGFQWMADSLAPTVARLLHIAPPALVNDRPITVTPATAAARRKQIVDFIWGAPGLPAAKPAKIAPAPESPIKTLKNAARIETFTIDMENGQQNTTHHLLPKSKPTKLVILQHGHACTFDDAADARTAGMAHTADSLLGAGYAVLLSHMPHMRPGDCGSPRHGDLFDLPVQNGSPLKFFLEPVLVSLNHLRPAYREIHMAGLSGGGWTTTLIAALLPEIKKSFPVAGTMPLYLRANGSIGDEEQFHEAFYKLAGYPDLYVLGAAGPGRAQIQILNRKDNCCFGQAQHPDNYEPALREYEKEVQKVLGPAGRFRLDIDETATHHMISPAAVQTILKELAR